MTITSTVSRVTALGNGVATTFSFSPVIITEAIDLDVWLLDNLGNQTLLAQGTAPNQYQVVVPAYPGTGSITYPGAGGTVLATGWSLVMKQRATLEQQFQPTNQGPYLASAYGNAFDYAMIVAQNLQEQINRSIIAPETDPAVQLTLPSAAARASQYLAFDSGGNPIAALSAPGTVPISSVMQPVVDASTVILALGLLGGAPTLATIAALRAYAATTPAPAILVGGFYTVGDGAGGTFVYVSTDTTSADNGGTIIIDATTTRRWYRVGPATTFNVKHFGATGNGVTDDTTNIQKAITACGVAGGGFVDFPPGNYAISAALNIGNGTSASVSTVSGIVLRGSGVPISPPSWAGYSTTTPTTITWLVAGGASIMINVKGPIQGWGVQNLLLNGASTATVGILATSAQFGDCRNLAIEGCRLEAIGETTLNIFGSVTQANSMHNQYNNININIPDVAGAKGIVLTGYGGANSDTCYDVYTNITIVLAPTQVCYGLYLQNCENTVFTNVHMAGGGANAVAVTFDYTASPSNVWPSGMTFVGVDTDANLSGLTQWQNSGTPGASSHPHSILFLDEDNGAPFPAAVANMQWPARVLTPKIALNTQSTTISGTTILTPYSAVGDYRVNVYLVLQAAGNSVTVTASIGWQDIVGSARTLTTSTINMSTGSGNPQQASWVISATNAATISYSTSVSADAGTGRYALYITVEKLS